MAVVACYLGVQGKNTLNRKNYSMETIYNTLWPSVALFTTKDCLRCSSRLELNIPHMYTHPQLRDIWGFTFQNTLLVFKPFQPFSTVIYCVTDFHTSSLDEYGFHCKIYPKDMVGNRDAPIRIQADTDYVLVAQTVRHHPHKHCSALQ